MIKSAIVPIMICLLCYGVWLILQAGQFNDKFAKAKDWHTLEGRILERSDGVRPPGMFNPLSWARIITCQPYFKFSYKINEKRYECVDRLPPVLTLVRIMNSSDNQAMKDYENIDYEEASKLQADYLRKHPEKMNSLMKPDGKLNLLAMFTYDQNDEEMDYLRPKVMIKYRPSDPSEAVTEKDEMNGYKTLIGSGVACVIIAILVPAALFYHSWLTKPAPETDLQLYGRSSIKY